MKVIFLDIDGVLNSRRSSIALRGYGNPSIFTLTNALSKERAKLDPIAFAILNRIIETYDFKVVISSTWRLGFSEEQCIESFNALFKLHDAKPVVIGVTPALGGQTIRGDEINKWLSTHLTVTDYLIIDDSSDFTPDQRKHHLIKTDLSVGLGFNEWTAIVDRMDSAL